MLDYLLILKGNNKELAIAEFETLWKVYFNEEIRLDEVKNVIYKFSSKNLIEDNHEILSRLTYTNILVKILSYHQNLEDLKNNLPDLKEYDGKKFKVRSHKSRRNFKSEISESELAKVLWNSFDNPKVDIKNFEVEFNFIFIEDVEEFYFTVKIYENEKDYLRRMPKLRPVKMPYTLKSDMARAAINLLGIKEGKILDPFCGIGGILLEAYDMDFEVIGNDISWNDLKYFKENFDYFYHGSDSKYKRILADSQTKFLKDNVVDGIVTDIPYGKCSRRLGDDLYNSFLKNSKQYLKKGSRMVVIYANFVEFKSLALKYFDEILEVTEYINKDLTRYILVLENK
ncbi:MAG: methyltransferase [Candidatus Woesearchaeota archaeon]|jgi:tRNA (guanine10-N2)-dimethyltransferase|nr:methyltransferase [Candidatus Woesearchaeota archaeon]